MTHSRSKFDVHRRAFLGRGAAGLGLVALNSLLSPRLFAAAASLQSRGVVNPLNFPPKAKRVIFLYQAGGPSHLETFDYKPKLAEMNAKAMPESFTKGQQIAQLQGKELKCFGPQYGFKTFGKSGQHICELFPHIGSIADDICIVRSMWTEQINHDPAHT
ncbi:MAG TPA: sulfatase, partial [Solibacterales bacterium]|nr:sulfatase [Bryobacterales bacterium]